MTPILWLRERHHSVRTHPVMDTFTVLTRWLLAFGFIPPGMTKALGNPFTIISPETPVGSFFEVFFQSGSYYTFVGLGQVLAGLLLLTRRSALLGSMLYFPIMLNIVVITWAMGFRGTWLVTFFMLGANLFLLFWHFDRLQGLFVSGTIQIRTEREWRDLRATTPTKGLLQLGAAGLGIGLASLATLIASTRGYLPEWLAVMSLCLGAAALPLVGAAGWEFIRHRFRASHS